MDIYTNPPRNTYVTGVTKIFMMPTDSGGIPAVAVSKNVSVYISSMAAILMVLIPLLAWNLILSIVTLFWRTRGDPSRESALDALTNSVESMNAIGLMAIHCREMIIRRLRRKGFTGPTGAKAVGKPATTEAEADEEPAITEAKADEEPAITEVKADEGAAATSEQPDLEERDWSPEGSSAPDPQSGTNNLRWVILFLLIAFAMSAANIVSGILVSVKLPMGNVAPAARDAIFYPNISQFARSDDNGATPAILNSLRAPSALRALGSIQASRISIQDRVKIEPMTRQNGAQPWLGLNYNYNVTGVDMGLQTDPKLVLRVKGSCHTEYTWLVNSTDQTDSYILFGDRAHTVIRQAGDIPPSVAFAIDPKTLAAGSSNTSYAIIVNTAGRRSDTPGEDPWYATGKSPANITAQYQVLPGRPALSCWETSTWHLNGKEVASFDLAKLPGLKLHKFWAETVLPLEFAIPRVITLGRAAGLSALKAAAYAMAPGFVLDAGASGIHDDLQRLVLASWVNSRGVLRDTTTYEGGNMSNSAKGPGGSVEASAAKFVLQSGDVDTLSVRVLIAIPVIFVFLFIVQKIFGIFVRYSYLGHELRMRRLRDAKRQRPPYTT